MNITSARFIKGIVGEDELLEGAVPQVAFIGRSNVGKSSVINSLAGKKGLAKTSSFPGHTREINIFLINNSVYLVDLPGYGFARASKDTQNMLQQLIYWYLLGSAYTQKKVVMIVDAVVGATDTDIQMLHSLEQADKKIVIMANKVDKLKKSEYHRKLKDIQNAVGDHRVIPYSAEKRIGVGELANQILV